MDLLQTTVLGNTLQTWLLAALVAAITLVVLRLFRKLVLGRFRKVVDRTTTRWDNMLWETLSRTKGWFWVVLALYAGARALALSGETRRTIGTVTVLALIVQGGIWVSYALQFWLTHYRREQLKADPSTATTVAAVGFLSKLVIWTLVLLLVLDNLGVDITALVAGLGVGGIAVALAVQNILGDLFASLSIVLDKPFVIGDFLVLDGFAGSVEYIGLKTTRVRSLSGEQLVFANSDLLSSRVRNFGRMFERRILFKLGVTYQTPRAKLQEIPAIIRAAVTAQEKTRFDRSHFMEYGDFSLNVETVYYVLDPSYNVYMDIHQAILLRLHEEFETRGIEFAYPTQTVFVERAATASEGAP